MTVDYVGLKRRMEQALRADFCALAPHLVHELKGRDLNTLALPEMMEIADRN
jgi:hypothetical protein